MREAGLDLSQFEPLKFRWWFNATNPHSQRLTNEGCKFFTDVLSLPCYEIKLSDTLTSRNIILLERLIKDPYNIRTMKTLNVFGEEDAVMLQLHGGNISRYLDNMLL